MPGDSVRKAMLRQRDLALRQLQFPGGLPLKPRLYRPLVLQHEAARLAGISGGCVQLGKAEIRPIQRLDLLQRIAGERLRNDLRPASGRRPTSTWTRARLMA